MDSDLFVFSILDTKISNCLPTLIPDPSPDIRRREFRFLHVWLDVFVFLLLGGEDGEEREGGWIDHENRPKGKREKPAISTIASAKT
jgi:hypothetical protein